MTPHRPVISEIATRCRLRGRAGAISKSRHQKTCVRRRVCSEVPADVRAQVIEMAIKGSSFWFLAVPLAFKKRR